MKTILVNPPIRLPRVFAHYPIFSSLGLLSNAAWLRQLGHEVRVVDAFTLDARLNLRDDGGGFHHVGAEVDGVAQATLAAIEAATGGKEPLCVVLGLTMFSDMNRLQETLIPQTTSALARLLPAGIPLGLADLYIAGMNYFPFDPVGALDRLDGADWILVGEGEPTLPELLDRISNANEADGTAARRGAGFWEILGELPHLGARDSSGVAHYNAEVPERLADLDQLPPPAFDLIDMDRFFSVLGDAIEADLVHEYHVVERQLPLMTSRACPFRCSFCTTQVLGLPWRAHSVDYLRRLVGELRERYQVDRLLLLDDNINVDQERFRELVAMLADEGMAWDAVNGFRADRLDRDMVRAIKAAGNTKITVSAESGDAQLLKKVIRKGLKLSAVVELARICQEERVPLQIHYILGVPGETKAQINKTLELATELFERHGAWPLLQHAIPFPGTRMFRDCEEQGWFVAPPETISGARLEVESIIRTPELQPEEAVAMKRNAQHLHAAEQRLTYLEVEASCDCDCVACHCASKTVDAAPSREALLSEMEWARFLGATELFLGGGEPTLRSDLAEIASQGRDLGFRRIRLVTNGHGLARREPARRLIDAGVTGLVVDLLGPSPASHDALARTEGAFRWTLAGIRQAQRLGCNDIEANLPVTTTNLEALPGTVALAIKLGLRAIHLQWPPPDAPAAALDQLPEWDDARPWLLRALDAAPQGMATIQGAPLCLLPERPGALVPQPPWELRRTRHLKTAKDSRCRNCVDYILCGGFYRTER